MPIFNPSLPVWSPRYFLLISAVVMLSVISMLTALCLGSADISIAQVFHILAGDPSLLHERIVLEIRLPRVLTGMYVGGMLALAGCLMQILLRNPLADPYVLGISGGAAVFALLAMIAGLGGYLVNGSAFAGALLSIMLVFMLSRPGNDWNPLRILLTGVVIAAGWGAMISFLLAVSPPDRLHGMLFWLMGDLSYVQDSQWNPILLFGILIACLINARGMNLLASGELNAAALGLRVGRLQYFCYFAASLLTATAVMQAGSIGFIGLVVPHLARILFGSDHRILLPVSVMLGGSLLVIADGLARSIIAPEQLPVGVLTAMIGVPLFLVLLQTVVLRQRT
jgi:iron complex transport system permease protein